MSPRGSSGPASSGSSTRYSTSPYSRRVSSQPKSTRQQFSACGACRMRRVRCDLKDRIIATAGPNPSCSNCKERNIKCVDEFADVKAVKLLRRGRRLQQVEAIYGKSSDGQGGGASGTAPSARLPSIIPNLRPEFFASAFWLWFCVQRPILDSIEFPSRFYAHTKGTQSLGHEGGIIAMLLVIWAASFGLDEQGLPFDNQDDICLPGRSLDNDTIDPLTPRENSQDAKLRERKDKIDAMLREVLELIDFHGVMRRPSFDGIQALLLALPLLEDAPPLEKIAIHEATLSQVRVLCSPSHSTLGQTSTSNDSNDILLRARIFWYTHTHEGLITGMKGGRFVLSRIPLRINGICRRVHEVLTGTKAARCAEGHGLIEANGMREVWRDFDRCWRDLEVLKETVLRDDDPTRRVYTEQYACAWQIVIFECHNLIRESLKQYMSATPTQQMYSTSSTPPKPSSNPSNSSPYLSLQELYSIADRKCLSRLPLVVDILKRHLSSGSVEDSALFRWDAGLIKDGCFFAAYLAAAVDGDLLEVTDDPELKESGIATIPPCYTTEEGVATCIAAFTKMRWVSAKNEERLQTIKMVWDNRKRRRHHSHRSEPDIRFRHPSFYEPTADSDNGLHPTRPSLPPLSMFTNQRRVESAPSTSYTTDGTGTNGWPSYTPPGTATSGTTSTGTGLSARNSPVFPHIGSYKNEMDETYYHSTGGDVGQFSFNVPLVASVVRDPPAFNTVSPLVVGSGGHVPEGGSHFGENCQGTYH
ncbi:hypothetical protein AGABI2DRAFT_183343 [Agaricus bisporus var. bisporus H97]|uniref:hypothetical protein n=1 Tax=Agaricus bisporus var. bisporus (strain H97 / ATCC MYA-4626 / FGSC 10389) TaxID=936046 RepID=UPI00029F5433|nr:hypothetical protein AGABI2DRAFT_183343 [Agaricus bisporus var. bisporus H97]EKV50212.1 hypothetical protein AGABI2DRAFT_183343 [Agaricus bisporus var. bisporus H97]